MAHNSFSSLFDSRFIELVRASLWVLGARLLTTALGFLTVVLIARWFGAEATGFTALISSAAAVFSVFATFGLDGYVMREFASSPHALQLKRKRLLYFRALEIVSLLSALFAIPTFVLFFAHLPVFSSHTSSLTLAVVAVSFIGKIIYAMNINITRAVARAPIYATFLLVPAILYFVMVVVFKLFGLKSLILPSVAYGTSFMAAGLGAFMFILFRLRHASEEETTEGKEAVPSRATLLQLGSPFAASAIFSMLFMEGNIVVAGFLLTTEDLGIYSISHRVAMLAAFFLTTVQMTAAPRFSGLRANGDLDRLKAYARRVSSLVFWASLPVLIILLATRTYFIEAAFGPQFLNAITPLTILLAGQIVNVYTGVTNVYLSMTGGQAILARIITIVAIASIGLTIALTPRLGLLGPAISVAIGMSLWNTAALVAIRLRDGFWMCYIPKLIARNNMHN